MDVSTKISRSRGYRQLRGRGLGSQTASTHHHTSSRPPSMHTVRQQTCRVDVADVAATDSLDASTAGCSRTAKQSVHTSSSRAWPAQQQLALLDKRSLLLGLAASIGLAVLPQGAAVAAADLVPAILQLDKAPDQSLYNPADKDLREAAALLQQALNAETVHQEEALWTQVIDKYSRTNAIWMPDVVGRAYGNRGNARSRQGKLAPALSDFNAAIQLCPWSVDPVINRGVVLEALGRWDEAAADYQAVLAVAPGDPSAWNNLGNTNMGLQNWAEAERCFGKAAALAPSFSFAAANHTLALYQLGRTEQAIREMRTLLRRYPDFPDMRAALAAAQWAAGREGDAETNWERVEDPRYRDVNWLRKERRWPPALSDSLQALLQLKSV
ncbi:hypothetical protein COO60DRAFT_1488071 [Scenedesmus sp. NREL 46B-D3]|nr:hypothetical protein COO60DRAFT_1488071 [Scenedesmus sp. NREL 46B-D3]